jgi:hypothetical protein
VARKTEIKVAVSAEIRQYELQMQKAAERAQALSKALKATDQSAATVTNALRNLGSNLSVMRGPLDGVAGRVNAVATLMGRANSVTAILTVSLGGLAAAMTVAGRQAAQTELSMARMDGALKATGYASGLTTRQLEEMTQKLAYSTLASEEGVRSAIAQLLTFRTITKESFEETLRLAQDLSETGFGSLESSAVALAKAMEDPATGLSSLRERGISFTESQRDAILAADRLGETLKVQGMILDVVKGQVEGVGEAVASSTFAGKLDTAGQNLRNFFLIVSEGTGALRLAKQALDVFNGVVDELNDKLGNDKTRLMAINDELTATYAAIEDAQQRVDADRFVDKVLPFSQANMAYLQANARRLVRMREEILREQKRQSEEEAIAARKSAEEQAKIDEQKAAALAKNRAKALQDEVDYVNQQIEVRKTAGLTARGEDIKAEEARYAGELARLATRKRKALEDNYADTAGIEDQYRKLSEVLEQEHQDRLIGIRQKAAEEAQKAALQQAKEEYSARVQALESQSKVAGLRAQYEEELRLAKEAADLRLEAEIMEATTRGQMTLELEAAFAAQRLLIQEEYFEKLKDLREKYGQEAYEWDKRAADLKKEQRKEDLQDAAGLFGSMAELAEMGGERNSAAFKTLAVAQATIQGILAVQGVLADPNMNLFTKMAMLPVVAALAAANVAKIVSQRALGGPVSPRSPYLVGERGPEVFIPTSAGSIAANNSRGGGSGVNINIVEDRTRGGQTETSQDGAITLYVAAVKADIMRDIRHGTGIGAMVQRR